MNEDMILDWVVVKCGRVTARIGCHDRTVSMEFGVVNQGKFYPNAAETFKVDEHPELEHLFDGVAWDAHELLLLVDKYCREDLDMLQQYIKRQMKKHGLEGRIEGDEDVHD